MFFVYHLQTYSPKNRAWKKVIDYVEKYKNVLIKDELSLDALKHEIGDVVNRINAEHPKMKRMKCTATPLGRDCTIRIEAHVISGGCPDTVFFLDICKVRSIFQFSEKANMLEQKGGENGRENTTVNGIVLDDSISNCLLKLQNNRAASLAELLDDSIGFLLEYSGYFYDNSKTFLDILATLHNARTEFLGLIPNQKGGAQ